MSGHRLPGPEAGWGIVLPFSAITLVLVVIAQRIGTQDLDLGIGTVSLSPIVWAVVLGGAVSIQRVRPFPRRMQRFAGRFMETGILILIAKVGFLAGTNLKLIAHSGTAMLTQELGHLFGTVVLSLPLAVVLGMGRPSVGACFSIDRETSFSMVTERYGRDSPEYNGVLAMYIFGSVFGALWMTVLGSFLAGRHIFDPLALAMGTGVGSASMMVAAATAIADAHPGVREQVLTLGSVSSLATALVGLYVSKYLTLPLTERLYRPLARWRSSRGRTAAEPATVLVAADPGREAEPPGGQEPSTWPLYPLLLVPLGLATAMAGSGGSTVAKALLGLLVLTAVVIVARYAHGVTRLSTMILASSIGCLLGCPISPVAGLLDPLVDPVSLSVIGVVALAIAGLGLGKDWTMLKAVGWRVIPVGMVSIASSFVLATVIAHFVLGVG